MLLISMLPGTIFAILVERFVAQVSVPSFLTLVLLGSLLFYVVWLHASQQVQNKSLSKRFAESMFAFFTSFFSRTNFK